MVVDKSKVNDRVKTAGDFADPEDLLGFEFEVRAGITANGLPDKGGSSGFLEDVDCPLALMATAAGAPCPAAKGGRCLKYKSIHA